MFKCEKCEKSIAPNSESTKEFKIKELNNMTNEEILWALKKIPRNNLSTHDKTLLIGCIESIKNIINKGETNCMKTEKETKMTQAKLLEYYLEKMGGKKGKALSKICEEARKVIKPIPGYKDLRFNGKTCWGYDILPGLKAGEKYTFFSNEYDDEDELLPFNFTCGKVVYSRKGAMQWVVVQEQGSKKWQVYYTNGSEYCLKPNSDKFHTLEEAIAEAKETAKLDDEELG